MNARHPLMRPLYATAVLLAIGLGWIAWGKMHAQSLTAGLDLKPGKAHYAITLAFAPEAFHVTRLQAIGRVIEVKDATVFMMDVAAADIGDVATNYWVREVASWPGR